MAVASCDTVPLMYMMLSLEFQAGVLYILPYTIATLSEALSNECNAVN